MRCTNKIKEADITSCQEVFKGDWRSRCYSIWCGNREEIPSTAKVMHQNGHKPKTVRIRIIMGKQGISVYWIDKGGNNKLDGIIQFPPCLLVLLWWDTGTDS